MLNETATKGGLGSSEVADDGENRKLDLVMAELVECYHECIRIPFFFLPRYEYKQKQKQNSEWKCNLHEVFQQG